MISDPLPQVGSRWSKVEDHFQVLTASLGEISKGDLTVDCLALISAHIIAVVPGQPCGNLQNDLFVLLF
jgi:hypothetical protein